LAEEYIYYIQSSKASQINRGLKSDSADLQSVPIQDLESLIKKKLQLNGCSFFFSMWIPACAGKTGEAALSRNLNLNL
jgi:hypothetical protein